MQTYVPRGIEIYFLPFTFKAARDFPMLFTATLLN